MRRGTIVTQSQSYTQSFHLSGPLIKYNRTYCIAVKSVFKIVSEYDQEIPQSQTADNPVAPRGRATQPSRNTRKTN